MGLHDRILMYACIRGDLVGHRMTTGHSLYGYFQSSPFGKQTGEIPTCRCKFLFVNWCSSLRLQKRASINLWRVTGSLPYVGCGGLNFFNFGPLITEYVLAFRWQILGRCCTIESTINRPNSFAYENLQFINS